MMSDASSFSSASQKRPFKLDLGRVGIFVAIPVILWAFYTTSRGMIDIMSTGEGDFIGPIGATIGSAAILTMLALTSWSFGADLAAFLTQRYSSRPSALKVTIVGLVFLFVFSLSAFFSFTYYYRNIVGLSTRQLTGERLPVDIVTKIIPKVEESIETAYAEISKRIRDEDGGANWSNTIEALIKVAGTGGTNLREAVINIQDRNRQQAENDARARGEVMTALQAANREIKQAEAELHDLANTISSIANIMEPKLAEIAKLRADIIQYDQKARDAERGLDNLGVGCGRNCNGHKANSESARNKMRVIESSLENPRRDHSSAISKQEKLSAGMLVLRQTADGLQTKLNAMSPTKTVEVPLDVAGTIKQLSAARDQFRANPTWSAIGVAKSPCVVILTSVGQSNTKLDLPSDFDCEPWRAETRQLLTLREQVLKGRESFTKSCAFEASILQTEITSLSQKVHTRKLSPTDGLLEAGNLVETCISSAKAAGISEVQVQTFRAESEQFIRNASPDRNKFEQAREAFWNGGPDATMALGIAVAQDSFILILKLLAEIFGYEAKPQVRVPPPESPVDVADHVIDAPELRTLKLLLRESRPEQGNVSKFEPGKSATGMSRDIEHNLVAHLNRMIRDGSARLDKCGAYIIDNEVLRHIEAQVRAWRRSGGTAPIADAPRPENDKDVQTAEPGETEVSSAGKNAEHLSRLGQYFSKKGTPNKPLSAKNEESDSRRAKPKLSSPSENGKPLTFEELRARRSS
jgi:hypothetical protein